MARGRSRVFKTSTPAASNNAAPLVESSTGSITNGREISSSASATAAVATGKQWNATRDFAAPARGLRLYPWEKLAQVMLETNELTFVN